MRDTAQSIYKTEKLADAEITSDIPISKKEQGQIKNLSMIKKVNFVNSTDVLISKTSQALRIQSMPSTLSKISLTKGKSPTNSNEIVLNNKMKDKYKLGDTIRLKSSKKNTSLDLTQKQFKIVGFATSSEFLKKDNIGDTAAGNGSLSGFGYVTKSAFKPNTLKSARVEFKNVHGSAYSKQYEKKVSNSVDQLQSKLNSINNENKDSLIHNLNQETNLWQQKVNKQRTIIQDSQEKLTAQKEKLNSQKKALPKSAWPQLSSAEKQLEISQQQINKARSKVKAAANNLKKATLKKQQLKNISLTAKDRNNYNTGYFDYGQDANRIDALGKSFPFFFFLIAILVCFTTMRRMVEEKRIEMGTLKALGFNNREIMKEFLVYSFLAATLGTIMGSIFGLILLPRVIFKAYTANFTFSQISLSLHPLLILLSFIIALLSTVLASVMAAHRELKAVPAELMLPKPPAKGSRIFLERMTTLWNKMSFTHKVTARNLFRYKGRMLMTIIGIAGATAIMITGFGIKDSLNTIIDRQFGHISNYDLISIYNPDASKRNTNTARAKITESNNVSKFTPAHFEQVYAIKSGDYSRENISLMEINNPSQLVHYTKLQDYRTNKRLKLNNKGVIISQKLAKLHNKSVGDDIKIHENNGKTHKLRIAGITKMYAGHFIYMNRTYYQHVYQKKPRSNAYMLSLKNNSTKAINRFAKNFDYQAAAVGTIRSAQTKKTIEDILGNLNNLIIVLVLSASLLSLVVLYTLTNINVSERIRELSTLKVLGFYPREVLLYIYREVNILTGLGIILGIGFGYLLHGYIMSILPPATAMVAPGITWTNIIISTVLTIVFSLIVMFLMNRKIQSVDMLEALKSVD